MSKVDHSSWSNIFSNIKPPLQRFLSHIVSEPTKWLNWKQSPDHTAWCNPWYVRVASFSWYFQCWTTNWLTTRTSRSKECPNWIFSQRIEGYESHTQRKCIYISFALRTQIALLLTYERFQCIFPNFPLRLWYPIWDRSGGLDHHWTSNRDWSLTPIELRITSPDQTRPGQARLG